ncbi:MAG: hypothetical protein AB1756_05400 [Acidobacteriota bacterium]
MTFLLTYFTLSNAERAETIPSSIELILEEAQQVQETDIAAWRYYRFKRRVEREELDGSGKVLKREEMEFLITPGHDGFDEMLIRLNDRSPTSEEITRHQRLARFNRHYRTLVSGSEEDEETGGYSLRDLMHRSSYQYDGQETVDDLLCHRINFHPDETRKGWSLRGRFIQAMAGTLWITVDGYHLYRARVRMVRPIPILFSLAEIYDLQIHFSSMPVSEGVYLPQRIEVMTSGRVLMIPFRRRNIFSYGNYMLIIK